MEKIIFSLIKENNRVIIPNFGAFIVAKENGYTILFNNFLSFNDGLLTDYIAETEDISKDEAADRVSLFVKQIKEQLDLSGRYKFGELGVFTKDTSGILRFTQNENIDEYVPPGTNDLLDLDHSAEATIKEEEPVAPIVTPPSLTKVNEEPLVEVVEDNEAGDNPPSSFVSRYKEEEKKRRKRSAVIITAIILLPLIGTLLYLNFFKQDKGRHNTAKVEKVKVTVLPADTVKSVTPQQGLIKAGPEVKKEQVQSDKTRSVSQTPHHIIVGSFKRQGNADRLVQSLRSKGFDHCSTMDYNSRILVSLDAFSKVNEAYNKQEEVLNSHHLESWILTMKH